MKTMHTTFGPAGDTATTGDRLGTVEVVRYGNGVDGVRAFGRLWTPREADQIARLLSSAASIAAAHNTGALT